ncbi:MAG: type I methionyl aminopeptidase [Gemmataceae bacterium]
MRRPFTQPGLELKSSRDISLMREAGKLVARAHQLVTEMIRPGIATLDLDQAVEAFYQDHGATPLFKGYKGPRVPFPAVTCISLNEEVVHGIPSAKRIIKECDLVKVDTSCKLNGWCADAAVTHMIGEVRPERKRLVEVGQRTLQIAIEEMGRKKWWSEVAQIMQEWVEINGFHVVKQYVGHGIGRKMHESPQVPNFVSSELRRHDFRLEPGVVLAVEPMVNMGRSETKVLSDHWTVVTKDKSPSVHVEHTLAITKNGVEIITAPEEKAGENSPTNSPPDPEPTTPPS